MPWHDAYVLTGQERAAIEKSIQQFQLGEGSNGERLLKRGRAYSRAVMDPDFVSALGLFIKEEQRHSEYLAHFMRLQSIPRLESHWVDTVFRRLRGLAGLELSLRVLVTAEIIAMPFYRALREATGSPLLQAISARILQDEAAHLRYQSSMLARLGQGRARLWRRLFGALHSLFLLGTLFIVWVGHRRVFVASNYSFRRFKEETIGEFHRGLAPNCGSLHGPNRKWRDRSENPSKLRHPNLG